ncbi:MAG: heat-inducible transcription repressor HrcA [Gemmatimonadales bacterium]|uniref:heat-inducible transcriptional repressor HrcA n=1 Tax=Candidatus Palauibacter irciniicola TaxID=3056733 RepID=UPI001383A8A4|nr:heat-inducible transcription repressor HrcA [Candidatus Palauibacter irciniicola]MYC17665.1 heat-inducible transcription repressor HrcA [Gemmatimonadales bacterium]
MTLPTLTERERAVLAAVIDSFVRTAAPAGSRRIGKEYALGVSPATIRNTMADLESKGLLTHPYTSAGRLPTDLAYRYYVDALMRWGSIRKRDQAKIERELGDADAGGVEDLMGKAARVLSLLTGELGLAVGPTLATATLERLELVPLSSEKVLLVFTIESGVVRTVYVDVTTRVPRETLQAVSQALNERLAGSAISEIQATLRERLGDLSFSNRGAEELMNIFVHSGPDIFEWARREREIHLGSAAALTEQPEFTTSARLRELLLLTERRELLASVLGERGGSDGPHVTIGAEHGQPELEDLTIVTANYAVGSLQGTVGVIGPTRMPYDKVVSIVDWTSDLLTRLMP